MLSSHYEQTISDCLFHTRFAFREASASHSLFVRGSEQQRFAFASVGRKQQRALPRRAKRNLEDFVMNHAQRAGRDLDNSVANGLAAMTTADIRVFSARGSGNTNHPCLDVIVVHGDTVHDIELKRSSVNVGETIYVDITELTDVPQPRWFGIQFTRRELCLVSANGIEPTIAVANRLPDAFDPHVTDGQQLRLRKPDSDVWPSKLSGDEPASIVAETLSLPLEDVA
jgi:hypothetical protein